MNLLIYHFHGTTEVNKEHIQDVDSNTQGALCGYFHHNLSSNGITITLEWAKLNIPSATANRTLCKKCAKIAMKKLEKAQQNMQ